MLFDRHFDRPGPGVSENEARKKGLSRFFELLARDFGEYWKAGFLAFLCMLPGIFGVFMSLLAGAVLPMLLCGILGGALAGPCMAGLYDTVVRTLRDEPNYWWHTYKQSVARDAKTSVVPGAVLGLLFTSLLLMLYTLLYGSSASPLQWIVGLLCLFLLFGFSNYFWMQLVLLDLSVGMLLRNTMLLWIAYLPRTALACLIQIVYWGAIVLLFPMSMLPLVLTTAWLPVLGAALAVYKPLEASFHVEENVRKLHEAQRSEEDGDGAGA